MLKRDRKLFVEDLIKNHDDIRIVDIKNLTEFALHSLVNMYKCDIKAEYTLEQLAPFSNANTQALCEIINSIKSTESGKITLKEFIDCCNTSELKSFMKTMKNISEEMLYLYGIATTFQVYTDNASQNGELLSQVQKND